MNRFAQRRCNGTLLRCATTWAWDGFTAWLEADARHRETYDEIALADDLAARHGPSLADEFAEETEEVQEPPRRSRWPVWASGALAASLVALVAVPQLLQPDPVTYTVGATSRTVLAC